MTRQSSSDAEPLSVQLLDRFAIFRGGIDLDILSWRRPASHTIVKVLALAPGHRITREELIAWCWPDASPDAGRTSLRVGLHAVRHGLEPDLPPRQGSAYLIGAGDELVLHPGLLTVDVDTVLAAAAQAQADSDLGALVTAVERLSAELLPGDRFAEWAQEPRRRWATQRRAVTMALAGAALEQGSPQVALGPVESLSVQEPHDEEVTRAAMSLLAAVGEAGRAVVVFDGLVIRLREDLGVEPTEATRDLRNRLIRRADARIASPGKGPVPFALRRLSRGARTILPDRGRTLDELRQWLVGTGAAAPLIVLSGESGVGKSTLIAQAAIGAAHDGAVILWGAAFAGEGRLPYGPIVDAIDSWFVEQPEAGKNRFTREFAHLAGILPDPAAGFPADGIARQRLYYEVASFLTGMAVDAPVVVVLEDIHEADLSTVQLVHYLTRAVGGTRVRLLVTIRDDIPDGPHDGAGEQTKRVDGELTGTLAALARQGLVHRVELIGLSRRDARSLIGAAFDAEGGGPAAGAVVERLFDLSRGNPLLLAELSHEMARHSAGLDGANGPGAHQDVDIPLPRSVRELVAERVGMVGDDTRQVLAVLSVATGALSLPELGEAARDGLNPPLGGSSLDDAIDRGVQRRLIDEVEVVLGGRAVAALTFRHPIFALAVRRRLSAARQRRLHRALADVVCRHRPTAIETIAHHLDHADDPRAAVWLKRAAEHAATVFADHEADRLYAAVTRRLSAGGVAVEVGIDPADLAVDWAGVRLRRGEYGQVETTLQALVQTLEPADPRWPRATHLLAEALGRLGRAAEGIRLLTDPMYPAATMAAAVRAEGRMVLAELSFWSGRYEDALAAADVALGAASGLTAEQRVRAVGRAEHIRGAAFHLVGRYEQAQVAAQTALAASRESADLALEAKATSTLRELTFRSGRLTETLSLAHRVVTTVGRIGDPVAHSFERANLALIQLAAGEDDNARTTAAEALRVARSYGDTWCLPYCLLSAGEVAFRAARPDRARATTLLAEAEAWAEGRGDRQARQAATRLLAELDLVGGDPRSALARLDVRPGAEPRARSRPDLGHDPDVAVVLAEATTLAGDPAAGLTVIAHLPETHDDLLLELDVCRVRGMALRASGRNEAATAALAVAQQLADRIGHQPAARRVRDSVTWVRRYRVTPG